MITSLNNSLLQILVLALVGGLIGEFINWAIYRWGYRKWSYSPWSRPIAGTEHRKLTDYVPVFGWLGLRRNTPTHGALFWLRPLIIELVWTIGLPCFFLWELQGGLVGFQTVPEASWGEIWFWGHSILIGLMFIATFIDFDQRLIPDWITVPGTLIGLAIASLLPSFRLPVLVSGLQTTPTIENLTFMSPDPLTSWQSSFSGCFVGSLLFSVWIFALYPKIFPNRWRLHSLIFMGASMIRVWQRKSLKVRRYFRTQAIMMTTIWIVGIILLPAVWLYLPEHIDSLFGALVGLAFAGMLVWLIRIIGSHALGQEAMGFGDVTLLAMIGTFLGWQAALLIFAFAPFAGLAVTAANFIFTRDNELAFGPYLCISALGVILFWSHVWPWAENGVFSVGPKFLFTILLASLILFAAMLFVLRLAKGKSSSITETG